MSVDLATQILDYAREVHLDERPLTLDEITALTLSAEPVRPIGLSPHPPELRQRRRWLVAVASAAAALVLLGGLAWLSQVTDPDTPVADPVVASTLTESTPTTVPEAPSARQPLWPGLTEDIPEGVETGTLTTSLGTARWVHLSSDDTLPSPGPLEVNADGEFIVSDLPTGFWYSDSGIEWTREDESSSGDLGIPADNDQMTHFFTDSGGDRHILPLVPYADGSYARYWIISSDPIGIWNWEGGPSGRHFDLTDLVPPDSEGFTWHTDISRPITRNGNPEGNPEGLQHVLHVRFTGPDQQVDQRLLVLGEPNDAGSATYVEVPWDVSSDVTLFGTSHSVYAYVRASNSDRISVWQTGDGYRWTESGFLHAQLGIPSSTSLQLKVLPALQVPDNLLVRPVRNQLVVVTTPDGGWESTNGVRWTRAPEGFPEGAHLIRLESGWFSTDRGVWWMHLGDRWVSLAELGMDRTGDGCQIVPRGAGQTTIFFSTGTCTPDSSQESTADLWIISFDS